MQFMSERRLPSLLSYLHYVAWFQAAVAMAVSLVFSEVVELQPCVLCWYQRIAMYPLVLILGISIVRRDDAAKVYALPLALCGLVVAAYHNLVYYKVIPQNIIPCTSGVSCTTKQIEWLGFITIPLLSLIAFLIIVLSLVFYRQTQGNGE